VAREGRVALRLKPVGGFGVSEIARAFLAKEPTVAQRLARAKRLIRDEGITFDLPSEVEMSARLESVLEVLYLLFNEGYTAHAGENLVRADLAQEAIRLGSLVIGHPATNQPKCHALLALMMFQAARLPACVADCAVHRETWPKQATRHATLKRTFRSGIGGEFLGPQTVLTLRPGALIPPNIACRRRSRPATPRRRVTN